MPDDVDGSPIDLSSTTSFGPLSNRPGSPAPWARALAGGLIILTAVAFLWSGLTSAWRMWTGPSQGQLRIDFGILGLVLGFGLLARKRWARTATLLLCWVAFVGLPLLAMQAANPSVRVRYDLPAQLAYLAGPPAVVLIVVLMLGLALVPYVALMSRAGRSWYGLAELAGTQGPPLWLTPVAVWIVVAATAAVWLAGQRHIVPAARLGGAVQALAVDGPFAYVSLGDSLGVLDLADPDRPALVGQSLSRDDRWRPSVIRVGIVTAPGQAFVLRADGSAVEAFDTSDPRQPLAVGSAELPIQPMDMQLSDGRLFLVGTQVDQDRPGAAVVLAATGSTSPTIWLQFDLDQAARAVAVGADHWYVLTAGLAPCAPCPAEATEAAVPSSSLRVLAGDDLTWGNDELARLALPPFARDLALMGSHAYVLSKSGQLLVVDVTQPEQPTLVTTLDLADPTLASSLALSDFNEIVAAGEHLYAADLGRDELVRIDIRRPVQPAVDGRLTSARLANLAATAGRLYAVDLTRNAPDATTPVTAIDIGEPGQLRFTGGWNSVTPQRLLLTDRADYVLSADKVLYRLDLSEPERPRVLGPVGPVGVVDAATDGRDVFLVDNRGTFSRLSAAGQAEADLLLPATASDQPWQVLAAADGLAVLSDGANTLQLVDVSDPAQSLTRGTVTLGGHAMAVALANQRAYVLVSSGWLGARYSSSDGPAVDQVVVYDVATPAAPKRVGEVKSWHPLDMAAGIVEDGRLYVGDSEGLRAYSLADPDQPKLVREWSDSIAYQLATSDAGLFTRSGEVRLYGLRMPFAGQELSRMDGIWSGPLAARGDHVFTVDGERGLGVLRVEDLIAPLFTKVAAAQE